LRQPQQNGRQENKNLAAIRKGENRMDDNNESELQLEDEIDEIPYVEFNISVSPADPTLEALADKLKNKDLIVPFYQRKFVWKIEQASRLIESFLMGLPVPQVFFYVNQDNQLEIIDGQQRILSVKYFFEGYFGDEDKSGKRTVFKLKGLSELSKYNGKTFLELDPKDQRKLKNASLRSIQITQLNPAGSHESVFHIFERLNTGGTSLKPQEIRNAIYRGNILKKLQELNSMPEWQQILGLSSPDKHQKDVELILRLFSLFENWQSYQTPMVSFLNKNMRENTEFSSDRALRFIDRFNVVVKTISATIEKPFRPNKTINASVLDAVMVATLEGRDLEASDLKKRYQKLIQDGKFLSLTQARGTTHQKSINERIKHAKEVLFDATT
jgi:uncharacterized protein with ParB-like and HNH nuclease domain